MLPGLACHDCVDRPPIDPKLLSQLMASYLTRHITAANLAYLLLCKFGLSTLLTAQDTLRMLPRPLLVADDTSPLSHLVEGVVFVGAKKKMVRTDASRVITAMQDIHIRRDWAIGQLIREAVGTVVLDVTPRAVRKTAVAATNLLTRPKPTLATLINALPKVALTRVNRLARRAPSGYILHVKCLLIRCLAAPRMFVASRGFFVPIVAQEVYQCV
jgi:hypothetical protein